MSTYGERAYSFLEKLSFPRTSGSDKEHAAAEMIAQHIREMGLEPQLEPFEVRHHKPVKATFSVTAPEKLTYEVTGIINAQDTPEGGVDADFYYLEMIDELGLKKAKGKFLLLNERPSEEDYQKLMKVGIAGFMWMSGTARDTVDNMDLDTFRYRASYERHGKVPGFGIRMIDAMDMLLHRPEKVHFELHTEEVVATSYNVVTVIPGTDFAEEAIAVGGHYDSTEFSYGSWDNGAGTVQVLGLLEHLSKHQPRRTVKCILFGSEEVGLNGSKAFLAAHPEDQDSLLAMINLDVGGSILGNYAIIATATPGVEGYLKGLAQEAGHSAKVSSHVMSSDSAVFSDYGIPSLNLARMTPRNGGFMHTRYDNMKMISPDVLGEQIRILIFVVDRLTAAEVFPIPREISAELQKEIVKYFGSGVSKTEERMKKAEK